MSFDRQYFACALLSLWIVVLSACGGSDDAVTTTPTDVQANSVTVTASVTGLGAGKSFVLQDTLGNTLTVNANGTSSFANPIAVGAGYSVSVRTQPLGQTCSLAASTGTGVAGSSVNVQITCSVNSYRVSGLVSGLSGGNTVSLSLNGATPTTASNGAFDFGAQIAFGGSYAVTVATQPTGQTCAVSNASGAGMVADVSNVSVVCSANTYALGGSLSGLAASTQVSLLNNGADALTLSANGSFNFATPVPFGGSYAVTVGTQPRGQSCSASNANGTMGAAPVSNVAVLCSANTYRVGGSLSGLAAGAQVTLRNNGADPITLNANGSFNFPVQVPFNGTYAVTVATQPANGQTCSVTNASGTMGSADVGNVQVACVSAFTVGGSISGLREAGLVLANGADTLTIGATSTTFTLPARVLLGASFDVTVQANPTGAAATPGNPNRSVACTVSNGSGTMGSANISNITVTCLTTLDFPAGRSYLWTVPAGVTRLQSVDVMGGGGGQGAAGNADRAFGGDGAQITSGAVNVMPSEVFFVGVATGGQLGTRIRVGSTSPQGAGGGGGASWWVPNAGNPFADSRSIVAGGGGGGSGIRGDAGAPAVRGTAVPNAGFRDGGGGSGLFEAGRSGSALTAGVCTTSASGGGGAWFDLFNFLTGAFGSGAPGGAGGFGGTVANGSNFLVASGGSAGRVRGGGGGGSGAAALCGEGGTSTGTSDNISAGGGGSGGSYVPVGAVRVQEAENGGRDATGLVDGGNGRVVIQY